MGSILLATVNKLSVPLSHRGYTRELSRFCFEQAPPHVKVAELVGRVQKLSGHSRCTRHYRQFCSWLAHR